MISGLPAKHWDDDFLYLWQTLRAIQQDNPTLLSLVVADVALCEAAFPRAAAGVREANAIVLSPLGRAMLDQWLGARPPRARSGGDHAGLGNQPHHAGATTSSRWSWDATLGGGYVSHVLEQSRVDERGHCGRDCFCCG